MFWQIEEVEEIKKISQVPNQIYHFCYVDKHVFFM